MYRVHLAGCGLVHGAGVGAGDTWLSRLLQLGKGARGAPERHSVPQGGQLAPPGLPYAVPQMCLPCCGEDPNKQKQWLSDGSCQFIWSISPGPVACCSGAGCCLDRGLKHLTGHLALQDLLRCFQLMQLMQTLSRDCCGCAKGIAPRQLEGHLICCIVQNSLQKQQHSTRAAYEDAQGPSTAPASRHRVPDLPKATQDVDHMGTSWSMHKLASSCLLCRKGIDSLGVLG